MTRYAFNRDLRPEFDRRLRAGAVLLLAMLGGALTGCTSMPDVMSQAFVDPSRYDLYNCVQLRDARKGQAARINDLRKLMAKAETGAGGAVVSQVAYGNDYVSARANANLIEQAWQSNHCDSQTLPPDKTDTPDAAKTAEKMPPKGAKRGNPDTH